MAELERVFRPYDRDSSLLPPRLANLFGALSNTALLQKLRCEATTESRDSPCPNVALPMPLRNALGSGQSFYPQHITDLLKAAGIPQSQWSNLVPAEMMAGLKVNLNPPLGTLQYNASAGTCSLSASQQFTQYTSPGASPQWSGNISYDTEQQGTSAWPTPIAARQRLARYLYVLAMLLSDNAANVQVFTTEKTLSQTQINWLKAQRIAQWAINAVCFETNDSIMVPFKYDPNLLSDKMWGPSPNGFKDDAIGGYSTDPAGSYGVVWGCKPPELLMTEAISIHNRGVADTANDKTNKRRTVPDGQGTKTSPYSMAMVPTGGTTVKTLDQVRVPQGSLFIELYCPRSAWNQAAPLDLYTYDSTNGYSLDLNRLSPASTSTTTGVGIQYPVWRIVVSQSRLVSANNDVSTRLNPLATGSTPDSSAIEPAQYQYAVDPMAEFSLLSWMSGVSSSTVPNVAIDRIIWLANVTANASAWLAPQGSGGAIDSNLIYCNRSGSQAPSPWKLPGGHYLVLGPRCQTYIGNAYVKNAQTDNGFSHPMTAQSQYINLSSGTVAVVALSNNGATSTPAPGTGAILTPYSMVVAGGVPGTTNWPSAGGTPWSDPSHTGNGIGINISEPVFSSTAYYGTQLANGEPKVQGPDDNANDGKTWYDTVTGSNGTFITNPMETSQTAPADALAPFRPMVSEKPTTGGTLLQTGTTLNYKTLFLQRLANPTMPYDPISNPYRTVDWLTVDLTVFNGTDINQQDGNHGWNPAALPVTAGGKTWMNTTPPGASPNAQGTYVAPYAPFDPDDPVSREGYRDGLLDGLRLDEECLLLHPSARRPEHDRAAGGHPRLPERVDANDRQLGRHQPDRPAAVGARVHGGRGRGRGGYGQRRELRLRPGQQPRLSQRRLLEGPGRGAHLQQHGALRGHSGGHRQLHLPLDHLEQPPLRQPLGTAHGALQCAQPPALGIPVRAARQHRGEPLCRNGQRRAVPAL